MAYNLVGNSAVSFGLSSESGVVIQNYTSTETSETTELSAHNGTFSAVAFSNRKVNISASGNCSDSVGQVGQALTLTSNVVSSGTYYVTDASYTETADGFNSFDISATKFAAI